MTRSLLAYQAPPNLLAGRVILITGAGQGLGHTVALGAARCGATVIAHGRNTAKLERLYDRITGEKYPEPMILPLDLAHATDREFDQMAGGIESQLGSLSGIVHCAAELLPPAPIEQQRLDDWMRLLRVNLAAPMSLTRACARLLRTAPSASVIFTGETHGLHPAAFWGGFAAAKGALASLTRILAQEWEHLPSLRANMIVPGNIDSPQRGQSHPGEHSTERAPLISVLPAYLYLLGQDSLGITGQIFEL
ncbi:MAG: SDR family NAD(P)-dependent oxidoreductase [Betaproteobacteria bacterium]|nr:SDR family NAD(P)-dependent oxidoreductase [Betaproteobacteria bacterium]